MTHAYELEVIRWIQQFRNPFSDEIFKFFDFFDRQEFFFVLIPIVWLWYGWRSGLRLFYILFLSSLVNHAAKEFFSMPRPFHLEPDLGIIQVSGLGFPSGAAQTVILLSGILLKSWKSTWSGMLVCVYILLVCFSRIYLGIHFPTDILGGWLIGFCLLAIYLYALPPLEKQLQRLNPWSLFLLSQAIPMLLLIFQYSIPAIRICAVAMGMGLGIFIVHLFQLGLEAPKTRKELIIRALVGVVGTFACYLLALSLPLYLFPRFLLIGLWVSLGSHLLCSYYIRSRKITSVNPN